MAGVSINLFFLVQVNKLLAEPEQPQQYNEQQQNQSQEQQILLQQQQLPQQNQSIPRQIPPQPFQQQHPPSSNYQDTNQYSIIAEIRGKIKCNYIVIFLTFFFLLEKKEFRIYKLRFL